MDSSRRTLIVAVAVVVALLIAGLFFLATQSEPEFEPQPELIPDIPDPDVEPDPDQAPEPETELPSEIEVTAEEIRDQDGELLLHITDLPDEVEPDADSSFGGPTRFTNAVLSVDGSWIAIGAAGDAHGYGFLYDVPAEEHHLVAFQFGGEVGPHSWSPDDRFALFTLSSPAPAEFLKLVDREDIREYAIDTGFQVEVEQEEELAPPFEYEPTEWREPHDLCFRLAGVGYCVDAWTEEVQEER